MRSGKVIPMSKATITSIISKNYLIRNEQGELLPAVLAGKMRLDVKPVVGDIVDYETYDKQNVIKEIKERRNYLIRPNVANVDRAVIVMSMKEPDFSYDLVNRLIFLIDYADIEPMVLISKADLGTADEIVKIEKYYNDMGYQCFAINENFDAAAVFGHKISVLCGQSGVGKSTFINHLIPGLNLRTDQISKALNRGKHTTRHTELFDVYGGYIADTPGFSSLDVSHIDPVSLAGHIKAFLPYINHCQFNNCRHLNEPNCMIKRAVEDDKIPLSFYNVYVDIMNFIISGNFRGNRHRTLK